MKKLILLLLFFSNLSFCQTERQNYELYNLILSEQLDLGTESKTDSIILIEKYAPKFPPDFEFVADFTSDSIPNWALSYLSTKTYGNSEFVQRVINDSDLREAIKNFTSDFQNHPKLKAEFLEADKLNIQTITSEKYYSYFGRRFKRIDKAWKRIEEEYGTRHVLEFSKEKYHKNFATVFYEHHCGGLCGSGNMVVFEKINGKWEILSEINFWMS